jgi:uncharacterized protein YqhQ
MGRARGESTGSRPAAGPTATLGGQAVLEGVMMRGIGSWAIAVRRPSIVAGTLGAIDVRSFPIMSHPAHRTIRRLPVLRGVVALGESLTIGTRALTISANAQLPEDQPELPRGVWAVTTVISLALAIGLFFVLPVGVTSLVRRHLGSSWRFWLVEGVLRTAIFLAYLSLLSRVRDLRRVLEYHGAEHKVISCYEAGDELTPERAALYSRLHPRCGTSFLLLVMIISIFVFAPLGLPVWWVLVITRVVGVPVIAGLAFEVIMAAGRHRARHWVTLLMWPGLQLQRLTTREPDLEELAVSIASLRAVLSQDTGILDFGG